MELKKLSPQRINTPMKTVHMNLRGFSKEEEQIVSKYTKKCSTSLGVNRCKSKLH
jgi:hypothetical protein